MPSESKPVYVEPSYNQLISDLSTYVTKRAQRSDDPILLRPMDDVVGTSPEELLLSDLEHIKTSLHLMWWCCAMKATQSTFQVLRSPRQVRVSR